MSETRISVINPVDDPKWDLLIASHPSASFFHGSQWARVLQATYNHKVHYLAELDGDQARALLPILEVNSLVTGRRGVSLPFSDDCELLRFDGSDGGHLFEY